ncbi:hypothetical protein NC652_040537 [Populus alba x Populus x berolinensis]|nr:hypothetical protein NC652_040535 [Populus alba x Populus x berolinensis]KAJ6858027.1 hypothetical protein NC652_040537 [Populus alba x Populus x berolinensis]
MATAPGSLASTMLARKADTHDLLWLYKSQRKEAHQRRGTQHKQRRKKPETGQEETQKKPEKRKQKTQKRRRKTTQKQRTHSTETEQIKPKKKYTEKGEKGRVESQISPWPSSLQKKNNQEPRTIDNRHHHCLVSFILKQRRQNASKEKQQKERTQAEETRSLLLPSVFPEPGEKAKENENQRHSKAEEKRTDDHQHRSLLHHLQQQVSPHLFASSF